MFPLDVQPSTFASTVTSVALITWRQCSDKNILGTVWCFMYIFYICLFLLISFTQTFSWKKTSCLLWWRWPNFLNWCFSCGGGNKFHLVITSGCPRLHLYSNKKPKGSNLSLRLSGARDVFGSHFVGILSGARLTRLESGARPRCIPLSFYRYNHHWGNGRHSEPGQCLEEYK